MAFLVSSIELHGLADSHDDTVVALAFPSPCLLFGEHLAQAAMFATLCFVVSAMSLDK